VKGETLQWAYTKGAVEAARKHSLTLTKPDS
jgi:penicillin amidase